MWQQESAYTGSCKTALDYYDLLSMRLHKAIVADKINNIESEKQEKEEEMIKEELRKSLQGSFKKLK